jgi:hypothetical protein
MAASAVGYDMSDQLYAGSQAQSDSLIMMDVSGTDSDSQVCGVGAGLYCWLWQGAVPALEAVCSRGVLHLCSTAVPALICWLLMRLPACLYMQGAVSTAWNAYVVGRWTASLVRCILLLILCASAVLII